MGNQSTNKQFEYRVTGGARERRRGETDSSTGPYVPKRLARSSPHPSDGTLRTIRYLQTGARATTNHELGQARSGEQHQHYRVPGLVADGVDAHGGWLVAVARHLEFSTGAAQRGRTRRCRWSWAWAFARRKRRPPEPGDFQTKEGALKGLMRSKQRSRRNLRDKPPLDGVIQAFSANFATKMFEMKLNFQQTYI